MHCLLQLLLLAVIAISSHRVAAEILITHELSKVLAEDSAKEELFGRAVGISGDTLIVSAPLVNDNDNNSGAVYVFERAQSSNQNWNEVAKLIADDGYQPYGSPYVYPEADGSNICCKAMVRDQVVE